ncbi:MULTISPECIES: YjjG family noncanonical pyrimidine nucleotidase [unclassified Enterococcus]|uniref:YjjG family noncanonical pyrimidine nucleotidase n=1 Tax=unclassified Enterococcus TaxID=2608891 RepID=UPI001557B91F|nr:MULTISPECIES: YjjG family noncanonical pyrimidine nucleotidase [unclassified Enterococcus]MBS7577348.1 YjjG family noncanonical pyrimidine nucleotidase [Enterococcus sp. MMGLQ5-2]MBS7584755.1 YjjG family noncanonical pyrimidine nucleotidase [Enterococcus sp. MMGLQ5-1]NPD12610.1 noncanonical pyrimidine nucleotidase, YjjG family [Enterococcus sp. MMGLQ5-1]NPD37182.1 noncanonical pyrimidine nucleotidase, YjjG family [Enterococcus sp. MMGLQ5-2]
MKKIFIDIDDTILDFKKDSIEGLGKVYRQYHIPVTNETIDVFKAVNQRLWKSYELGELDSEAIFNQRFGLIFEQLGFEIDDIREVDDFYRQTHIDAYSVLPNAEALLQALFSDYKIYGVSNGKTGRRRLHQAQLSHFFDGIFLSEDMGYQKPQPQFFEYIASKIPNYQKEQVIMIGDTLTSDILGGNQYGIPTIWYNPEELENHTEIVPTREVKQLMEIPAVLMQLFN